MRNLVTQYSIVIVTHNMQQAARVSDMAGFFLADQDRANINRIRTNVSTIYQS